MHRIRTWARTKAHGPAPLVAEARRTGRASRATSNEAGVRGSADGGAPAGDVVADPAAPVSEKQKRKQYNTFMRFFLTIKDILFSSPINVLLVFVPVGIAVKVTNQSAGIVFGMNAIAIVPLAGLLSHATESVAKRLGDTIGALINVTFGNAVELIIFIIALAKDEIRIVQASLLGSILANLLLILGMCFLLGGLRFREQIYNSTATQMSACLLSLSVSSLLLPTAFHASFSNSDTADARVLMVSRGTSIILLLVYALYLVFQLNSHAYIYESTPQHIIEAELAPGPAANYFNSSSSSDTSSSSSSSDTDDTGHSRSRTKKIKRAIRGKRNRKQSTIAAAEDVAAAVAPVSPITNTVVQSPMEVTGAADDEAEGSEPKKTHRKKHKHRHRSLDGDNPRTQSEPANNTTSRGVGSSDGRRVDFAVAPELESQQTHTRPKPFALLSKQFSQNVFRHPHGAQAPEAQPTSDPHSALRRTHSMPMAPRSQRPEPGSFPPINPVIVNTKPKTQGADDEDDEPEISRTTAVLLLLGSTGLVALCAEFMVDSINEVVPHDDNTSGISEAFIGLILLPIVGNAAEHVTAVAVAMKNKMDLAIGVAIGSSIQIALFVTPLVVILGWIMKKEMSLFFTLFETVSMFVSAFIVNFLVLDGRSNYLEGALLCMAYVIIAVAAFFYPSSKEANKLGGGEGNSTSTDNHTEAITEAVVMMMARGLGNLVGL